MARGVAQSVLGAIDTGYPRAYGRGDVLIDPRRLREGRARPAAAIGLALALLLSVLVGQASAATVVGEHFVSSGSCSPNNTFLQFKSPSAKYTIPKPGVLTSWTMSGPAGGTLTAAFKVARETPPGSRNFLLVGGSAIHAASAGSSFTGNLSIRVQAGDVIGLYATSGTFCNLDPSFSYSTVARSGEHLSGTSPYPAGADAKLNVSAVLEDDVDGDGLGDESQDSDDDNDGASDAADNCAGLANADQANLDGAPDGGDVCDADDDNDGAPDATDNCARVANADQANTDGATDGGDACDADDDNDGAPDATDNCARVANADQANTDGATDGGDACDADDDNDGAPDATDKCVSTSDAGQEDFDQDGIGDACDPPTAGACANLHTGTELADTITGTIAGDRINALGGRDTVKGLAGADCLGGGGESDKLDGGDGADKLTGSDGADRLTGGSGNDVLSGGSDSDRLAGGRGKNRYSGGDGNDIINSVNGNRETVDCGAGRKDKVTADANDKLRGCERITRRR